MFSSIFYPTDVKESKECPADPVFTVVHRVDAVCALVADLMRLQDAVEHLKEVFNPNLCSADQRDALRELFLASEELFGPDVEASDDEAEEPIVVAPPNTPTDTNATVAAAQDILARATLDPNRTRNTQ